MILVVFDIGATKCAVSIGREVDGHPEVMDKRVIPTDHTVSALADVTIRVPATETYQVQEYRLPVYHYLCAEVERKFF